jgi:hypothetical protein
MGDRHALQGDSGSVLLLFPAAFLIVLALGAMAIDAAAVHLRQRELAAVAGAAANDAAMLGLDRDLLRRSGDLALDPITVERAAMAALDRRGVLDELLEPPTIRVIGELTVEVSLVAHAAYVIAPALPGDRAGQVVRASAHARAVADD